MWEGALSELPRFPSGEPQDSPLRMEKVYWWKGKGTWKRSRGRERLGIEKNKRGERKGEKGRGWPGTPGAWGEGEISKDRSVLKAWLWDHTHCWVTIGQGLEELLTFLHFLFLKNEELERGDDEEKWCRCVL